WGSAMGWFVGTSADARAGSARGVLTALPCRSSSGTWTANQAPVSTKTRRGSPLAPALPARRTDEDPIVIASPAALARFARLPDQPQQGLALHRLEPEQQAHRAAHEVGLRLSAPAGQPLQCAVFVLGEENL